ncbi:hypothetical protein LAZ40_04800 [Cereibacter sphaeroides]|uniref:hypothetical protein n=1 Tax=Cereibacter sphaeroides TaxID=1063 RepID=UPI001F491965|nr:hypothetical protein [Cereibacter sphaeroides]MCE6958375.1 hypothetical protein [Cereibacter sphaeroides]MCE6972242.1 hypothetical protein [Cereibacter sphaeroides]
MPDDLTSSSALLPVASLPGLDRASCATGRISGRLVACEEVADADLQKAAFLPAGATHDVPRGASLTAFEEKNGSMVAKTFLAATPLRLDGPIAFQIQTSDVALDQVLKPEEPRFGDTSRLGTSMICFLMAVAVPILAQSLPNGAPFILLPLLTALLGVGLLYVVHAIKRNGWTTFTQAIERRIATDLDVATPACLLDVEAKA